MFTLLIALAVAMAVTSVIAGLGGRRVISRCGMASALCAYANALTWDDAPPWQPIALLGGAALLLGSAIVVAVTPTRPVIDDRETDRG